MKAAESVTKADIKRVAQQHLQPANFSYVVVGNPDKFDDKTLKSLGLPVSNVDLTIPEPKKPAAAATPETLAKGKALLARVVTAVGGQDKLDAIKDYVQTATAIVGPGLKVDQKNSFLAPSAFRQDLTLPFGKVNSFFDGTGGWLKTPQGETPMAGPALGQMRQQMFADFFTLLRSNQTAGRTVNYSGTGAVEISDGATTGKLMVDEASAMPVKLVLQAMGPQGPVDVEYQYGDFKEVAGVKYPHKLVIIQAGAKASDSTITEMKANVGLKLEDLSKKP